MSNCRKYWRIPLFFMNKVPIVQKVKSKINENQNIANINLYKNSQKFHEN